MPKADPYNAAARRRVLQAFIDHHKFKVQTWTKASGLSESVVRHFLDGATQSMSDRTYAKLAAGASILLGRHIPAAVLRGDPTPQIEVAIHHYIGAGDEIHPVEGSNFGIDFTVAPPDCEDGGAGIVKGDSMRPLYEDGDVLFWRLLEPAPKIAPRRAVVVKVENGPLYVKKLLSAPRKGRFHLVSVNPITPVLEDQPIEAFARICWIKPIE